MKNRTQKATQDYQKKNWKGTEAAAGLQEAPEDNITEAQAAIMCFEIWQEMIINGTAPDPRRYEAEVLDFYEGVLAGTNARFYFMFMGFIGGLDFANQTDKAQEAAVGLQEAGRKIAALTPEQQDRLQDFLEVILASKERQATEADVVRCILGLPQEDIQPFTDILQAIGSRNK